MICNAVLLVLFASKKSLTRNSARSYLLMTPGAASGTGGLGRT